MRDLLIATNNAGKVREYGGLLSSLPVRLRSLSEYGIETDVAETGQTFEENAAIKATGYAKLSGVLTLADDSGLCIDRLGGSPGVRSARYAGEHASDADRILKVLSELTGVPADVRTARFVCVIALSDPDGKIIASVDGTCKGTITDRSRGTSGFGYDPIFLPDGFDKTFGELEADVKDQISHRANAALKIIPFLRGFFNI